MDKVNRLEQLSAQDMILLGIEDVAYVKPTEENGQQLYLIYAADGIRRDVKRVIGLSLVDVEHGVGPKDLTSQIDTARQLRAAARSELRPYQLSYCEKYVASPDSVLSYAEWTKTRILNVLTKSPIRVDIIIGSRDQRMDPNWPQILKDAGVNVATIEGANHFFDAEHEFDLISKVLDLLEACC